MAAVTSYGDAKEAGKGCHTGRVHSKECFRTEMNVVTSH